MKSIHRKSCDSNTRASDTAGVCPAVVPGMGRSGSDLEDASCQADNGRAIAKWASLKEGDMHDTEVDPMQADGCVGNPGEVAHDCDFKMGPVAKKQRLSGGLLECGKQPAHDVGVVIPTMEGPLDNHVSGPPGSQSTDTSSRPSTSFAEVNEEETAEVCKSVGKELQGNIDAIVHSGRGEQEDAEHQQELFSNLEASVVQNHRPSPHPQYEEAYSDPDEDFINSVLMLGSSEDSACQYFMEDGEGDVEQQDVKVADVYNITWTKDYEVELEPLPLVSPKHPEAGQFEKPYSPLSVFERFLTRDIVECTVKYTNEYYYYQALQKPYPPRSRSHALGWWDATEEELWQYFGELVYLGLLNVQDRHLLFAPNSVGGFLKRSAIKRDRFLHLESNLRVSPVGEGYTSSEDHIQPFLELALRNFQANMEPGEHICIDEIIIPFKGKANHKTYNPKKDHKFGFRAYILACSYTGYVFNILLHGIQQPTGGPLVENAPGGSTGKTVAALVEPYAGLGRKLYMDSEYTSPTLAIYLRKEARTDTCGSVQRNRIGMPQIPSPCTGGTIVRLGVAVSRGLLDEDVMGLLVVNHKRTHSFQPLLVLTTFLNSKAVKKQSCCDQTRPELYTDVPVVVDKYSFFVGGVERMGQVIRPHSLEKTRHSRWYIAIFRRVFNIMVYNAAVVYNLLLTRDNCPTLSFTKFRVMLADEIFAKYGGAAVNRPTSKPREPVSVTLPEADADENCPYIDLIFAHHLQYMSEKKKLRRLCVECETARRTTTGCKMCKVFLCSLECSVAYHQKHYRVMDDIRKIEEREAPNMLLHNLLSLTW